MKYSLATSCVMLMVLSINGKAQNVDNSSTKARNNINVYVGVLEGNINYERNISQRPKSYSNLRLGFGHAAFLNAGEGNYINPAFVHLIGEKSSHLEIDPGIKYMLTNSISDPNFSETVITDIFIGYAMKNAPADLIFE